MPSVVVVVVVVVVTWCGGDEWVVQGSAWESVCLWWCICNKVFVVVDL